MKKFPDCNDLQSGNLFQSIPPRSRETEHTSGARIDKVPQLNLWIINPERSFGSNQVVFGGMMLPVSAMSISCFIDTG